MFIDFPRGGMAACPPPLNIIRYWCRLTYDTIGVCSLVCYLSFHAVQLQTNYWQCFTWVSRALFFSSLTFKDSRITQYFEFTYFIWNFWLSLERHSRQYGSVPAYLCGLRYVHVRRETQSWFLFNDHFVILLQSIFWNKVSIIISIIFTQG